MGMYGNIKRDQVKSSLHGPIGGNLNLAAIRLIDVHGGREIPLLKSHSSS
jgi:hypothetical protein